MKIKMRIEDPGITENDYGRAIHDLAMEAGDLELMATAENLKGLISKVRIFLVSPAEKTIPIIKRFNRVSDENGFPLYAELRLLIQGVKMKMNILGKNFGDLMGNTIRCLRRLSRRTTILVMHLNEKFGDIQNGIIFSLKHHLSKDEISLLRETENDNNPFYFFSDEFGDFIFSKRRFGKGSLNLLKNIVFPSRIIEKIYFYGVIKGERIMGNYLLRPSNFVLVGNA